MLRDGGQAAEDNTIMYRIILVVDESFGSRVVGLAQAAYVWLVQSEENDRWARLAWEAPSNVHDPLLHGLSTFIRQPQEGTDDLIIRLLDMIDEHHGELAHDPEWSEIDVIGATCSIAIEETARTYGVLRCEQTPNGFRLIRHP
jgi:hypothetical protein